METINGLTPRQHAELSKPMDSDIPLKLRYDGQKQVPHEYVRLLLNRIYGHGGWSEKTLEMTQIVKRTDSDGWFEVGYSARVRLIIHGKDGNDRIYDGAGAWGVRVEPRNHTPEWELTSDAMNGALSVALSRASKSLGTRFGLALYARDPDSFPVEHSLPYLEWYEQHVVAPEQLDLTDHEEAAG